MFGENSLLSVQMAIAALAGVIIGIVAMRFGSRKDTKPTIDGVLALSDILQARMNAGRSGTSLGGQANGANNLAKQPTRVLIFIDVPNFLRSWRTHAATKRVTHPLVDWAKLPELLLSEMSKGSLWSGEKLRFIGARAYDSFVPYEVLAKHGVSLDEARASYGYRQRDFLQLILARVPGYEVYLFDRSGYEDVTDGGVLSEEKGVDTSVVADMLQLAADDMFDVALLMSDDADYLPAVEVAKRRFGKSIIHVGFQERGRLRGACWDHIGIANLFAQLRQPSIALSRPPGYREQQAAELSANQTTGTANSAVDKMTAAKALRASGQPVDDLMVGKRYAGKVSNIVEYGIFVEIKDGEEQGSALCHITETQARRKFGKNVDLGAHYSEGDEILVEVLPKDDQGRISLREIERDAQRAEEQPSA